MSDFNILSHNTDHLVLRYWFDIYVSESVNIGIFSYHTYNSKIAWIFSIKNMFHADYFKLLVGRLGGLL